MGRSRTHFQLSARHERWVLATGALLALTGLLWLIDHYLLATTDEFGARHAPRETAWLTLHGGAAMVFMVVAGTVLPVHARRAWHARLNHQSGISVLAALAVLMLTGFLLYYAGGEATRPWISLVHWVIGLVAVPTLILHTILGRRTARRLRELPRGAHRPHHRQRHGGPPHGR